jgi:hypothetical protein
MLSKRVNNSWTETKVARKVEHTGRGENVRSEGRPGKEWLRAAAASVLVEGRVQGQQAPSARHWCASLPRFKTAF